MAVSVAELPAAVVGDGDRHPAGLGALGHRDAQGQHSRLVAGLAAARARGRTGGRKPKMTPALINKAQRMYDSKQFTMAEIASSCGVTPMTVYRNIRTDPATRPTAATAATPQGEAL